MTDKNLNKIIQDLEETKNAYDAISFLIGVADIDGSSEINAIIEKINDSFKINIAELKNVKKNKKLEIVK